MKFIKINKGGTLVNLEEISVITSLYESENWVTYDVILKNSKVITLVQNRVNEKSYMPREELIEAITKLDK